MSTQYKDGTFGETRPMPEAMEHFMDAMEAGTAKALLVGTAAEVEAQKAEAQQKQDMQALVDRVAELEAKHSRVIEAPTLKEVEAFS